MAYERIDAIIKQDLNAYLEALKDDKPNLSNVYANRIVSNYVFAEKSENSLLGFILKEQAGMLTRLKRSRSSSLYDEAQEEIINQLEQLIEEYTESLTKQHLWTYYTTCEKHLRKYLLDEPEVNAYEETNPEFTIFASKNVIAHLLENKVLIAKSHIFNGTLGEVARLINTHGFSDQILLLYLYMSIIQKTLDYKKFEIDQYELSDTIISWMENKLINIELIISSDADIYELLDKINIDIAELGKEWRYYYIKYREIFRDYELKRPTKVLSDDEKEALISTFSSAIEKEMK